MIEEALVTIQDKVAEAGNEGSGPDEFEGLNADSVVEPEGSNAVNVPVAGNSMPALPAPRKRKELGTVNDGKAGKRPRQNNPRVPPKTIYQNDIGGMEDIIDDLLELIAMPLGHPEVHLHTGVSPPRGILFHGPPGTGKTMLANAIAAEVGRPFIGISAPSIVSGMSGESEKRLRELFEEAREKAPCLMFIDEIDAIMQKRDNKERGMERRIVSQMLTCMDDLTLEKTGGKAVVIIGATNQPNSLDPALRRPGRFDREVCLSTPDEVGREKILRAVCGKLRLPGDFDFKGLAKATPGFVGGDLSALAAGAGAVAMRRLCKALRNPIAVSDTLEVTRVADLGFRGSIQRFFQAYPDPFTEKQLDSLFRAIVNPIKKPELFRSAGVSVPAGVLLWGPPGCGKTLLAKAVANESRANFIGVRGPELLNKYVGESERAVRQVFSRARACIPCVIFFDELDGLALRRNDSHSESTSRVVNTLLTELDGLDNHKGIYVIGATNRPDVIDPAMLRPGRFDKLLFVDLPDKDGRLEILKAACKMTPLSNNVDLRAIAEDSRCNGLSGADLAALVREATIESLEEGRLTDVGKVDEGKNTSNPQALVIAEDFEKALGSIRPSVSGDDREQYREFAARFGLRGERNGAVGVGQNRSFPIPISM
ncbi:P-loop containing nucleoside triphosphate hydrolase protein [Tuber brumale]|nr:P-loop containing nucleoside triphosphate hydrolase protein [Tuber brumale]